MSASSTTTSKNVKQLRCNICNIIFNSIETLNAHNRMEHSEARHPPAGVG
jgi:Zinc-finger of C2H2 type